jgi:hypothetical protein
VNENASMGKNATDIDVVALINAVAINVTFDSSAEASVKDTGGNPVDAISSGSGELGLTFKAGDRINADVGVQDYAGDHRGESRSVRLSYQF